MTIVKSFDNGENLNDTICVSVKGHSVLVTWKDKYIYVLQMAIFLLTLFIMSCVTQRSNKYASISKRMFLWTRNVNIVNVLAMCQYPSAFISVLILTVKKFTHETVARRHKVATMPWAIVQSVLFILRVQLRFAIERESLSQLVSFCKVSCVQY